MFDLALSGNGFFAVRTPEGIQYTRNGNFSKNEAGLLVNPLGYPVLDANGAEIVVPERFPVPTVDASGAVRGRNEQLGEDQFIAQLQIVDFPELYDPVAKAQSPYQPPLKKSKDGLFIQHPATPQVPATGFEVVQGFLEEANVEPVIEMVNMIDIYRSYEAEYKAVQIQDSTLERAVNEVGRVG
jgi:flagellar basal-body rod protein FlgG